MKSHHETIIISISIITLGHHHHHIKAGGVRMVTIKQMSDICEVYTHTFIITHYVVEYLIHISLTLIA